MDVCVRLVLLFVENKTVVELSILSQFGTLLLNKPNTDRSNENTHFVYHVYKRQSHTCGCFPNLSPLLVAVELRFGWKQKSSQSFSRTSCDCVVQHKPTKVTDWLLVTVCMCLVKSLQNIGPGCHFSRIWTRSGTMLVKCSLKGPFAGVFEKIARSVSANVTFWC